MCAFGGFALVSGTVSERVMDADLLDHQDLVLEIDLTFGF